MFCKAIVVAVDMNELCAQFGRFGMYRCSDRLGLTGHSCCLFFCFVF